MGKKYKTKEKVMIGHDWKKKDKGFHSSEALDLPLDEDSKEFNDFSRSRWDLLECIKSIIGIKKHRKVRRKKDRISK